MPPAGYQSLPRGGAPRSPHMSQRNTGYGGGGNPHIALPGLASGTPPHHGRHGQYSLTYTLI